MWYIQADTNNGYPYEQQFPLNFNQSWYAVDNIKVPNPIWYIDGTNNGYPVNNFVPPQLMQTGWTSVFGGAQLPYNAWRITESTLQLVLGNTTILHEGYPYVYWWFKQDVSIEDGTIETEHPPMQIGGSQSNYGDWTAPSGWQLEASLDDVDMSESHELNTQSATSVLSKGLKNRCFALNSQELEKLLSAFRSESFFDSFTQGLAAKVMELLFGQDLYGGIHTIKVFPCRVPCDDANPFNKGVNGSEISLFGFIPIPTGDGGMLAYYADTVKEYNLGDVDINLMGYKYGWQFENIQWSVYLPFAGTFPVSLLSNDSVTLKLIINFAEGTCQYILCQNGQLIGQYKGVVGFDLPYSMAQGQTASNFFSNVAPLMLLGAGLIAPTLGELGGQAAGSGMLAAGTSGALAGSALGQSLTSGAVGAEMIGKQAGEMASKPLMFAGGASKGLSHSSSVISTNPSAGGLLDFYSYPLPRLIAKIPKLHKQAEGFPELVGVNRSMKVDKISEMVKGSFITCENYRCDLIVATQEEKVMINQLMNSGVFV